MGQPGPGPRRFGSVKGSDDPRGGRIGHPNVMEVPLNPPPGATSTRPVRGHADERGRTVLSTLIIGVVIGAVVIGVFSNLAPDTVVGPICRAVSGLLGTDLGCAPPPQRDRVRRPDTCQVRRIPSAGTSYDVSFVPVGRGTGFLATRYSDGTVTLMAATGEWAADRAPAPYPLREAIHDAVLGLAIDEAAATARASARRSTDGAARTSIRSVGCSDVSRGRRCGSSPTARRSEPRVAPSMQPARYHANRVRSVVPVRRRGEPS